MDNLIITELTNEELKELSKNIIYEEDKEECTRILFLALKTTRAFHDRLVKMEYTKEEYGRETVWCYFKYSDGSTEKIPINVTADSCVALIHDVFSRLYKYYT